MYVSGTAGGNDTATGAVRSGTPQEEAYWALENVEKILHAAGSEVKLIVSASMLITDKADYGPCNEGYRTFFADRGAEQLPMWTTALWGVPTEAKVAFSAIAAISPPAAGAR